MREQFFDNVQRVVIKIGTSALTESDAFYPKRIEHLAQDLAEIKKNHPKLQVVLVTSGAIPAGMKHFRLSKRPKDMSKLQAIAAMGQPQLMQCYSESFARYDLALAQLLLTWDDFSNRCNRKRVRSMCFKKRCPSPFPACAPSIKPGMSASTKESP